MNNINKNQNNLELTNENVHEQLLSGLKELQLNSFPSNHINWRDDPFLNFRDEKSLALWEKLRNKNIDNNLPVSANSSVNSTQDSLINDSNIRILADKFNPIFDDFKKKILANKTNLSNKDNIQNSKVLTFEDGKVIIDLPQVVSLLEEGIKHIYNHIEEYQLMFNSTLFLVNTGFLYKTINKSFGTALDNIIKDNQLFNNLSLKQREDLIKSIKDSKKVFSMSGAVIITVALYGMIHIINSNKPSAIRLGISASSTDVNVSKSLLIPFLNKNKLFKLILNIFIFIGFSIFIYSVLSNLSLGWFNIIKLITFILNILIVFYYLYSALILVKNLNISNTEKNMVIPKYYPSKFKKHILFLMNIDDINMSKAYIQLYLLSAIYTFLLLLILIFVNVIIGN